MTTIHDTPSSTTARRWRPNADGWMVGRPACRSSGRPSFWLGPDQGVGLSETRRLGEGTDALVWPSTKAAHAALRQVFEGDTDYYVHGFRVIRVFNGAPTGPFKDGERW